MAGWCASLASRKRGRPVPGPARDGLEHGVGVDPHVGQAGVSAGRRGPVARLLVEPRQPVQRQRR